MAKKTSLADEELLKMERKDNYELSKGELRKSLYICAFAFMMNYSAYGGLINLQSSMNVEEGLGAAGITVVYAVSSLSALFLLPLYIDYMGAKAAIITGEIGIAFYTLANFYPSWYTIMPAAVIHGLTESASWAGSSVYVSYLGEKYWDRIRATGKTKKHSRESCVYSFFCQFYTIEYMALILGNGLVSLLLNGISAEDEASMGANATIAGLNDSEDWSSCGANQCQVSDSDTELAKYKPDQLSITLLLSLFLLMQITFTLVHVFALPSIPPKLKTFMLPSTSGSFDSSSSTSSSFATEERMPLKWPMFKKLVGDELRDTFSHIFSTLHLLVVGLYFYFGVFAAFFMAEFTRAYISCTITISQVGFVMVVFGLSDIITSGICAKLLPKYGRNIFMCIIAFLHLGTYLACLLWEPTPEYWWTVYLLAILLGACDGSFQNTTQGMVAVYFKDRMAIAYSVKNLATNLGIVLGAAWSTSLCVSLKIYIIMGLFVASMILYTIAERKAPKKSTEDSSIEDENEEQAESFIL